VENKTQADRYNSGKPELTRIPFDCLEEVARVLMQGATKYPDLPDGSANWEKLWGNKTTKICLDSALRHSSKLLQGEIRDSESGQLHAAHIVVNMLFLIRHQLRENK
jgi:hypothetical protein